MVITVSVYEFCNYYTVAVITQSLLRLSVDFGLSCQANAALSNESQKLLTAAPYIDFWAVSAYPYASLSQIVPTQIC